MEEREYLIIGSDLPIVSFVNSLCRSGVKGVLVVDSGLEPGGLYGTSIGAGFKFEKFPVFINRNDARILEDFGFKFACRKLHLKTLKQGDYFRKVNCWSDSAVDPWWIERGVLSGGELCYPEGGWGAYFRAIFRGPCIEYLPYTPRRIDLLRRVAVLRNGRVIRYGRLVVSYPLNLILETIPSSQVSRELYSYVESVRWVDLLNIVLGVRRRPPEWDVAIHAGRASRIHTVVNLSNLHYSYSFKDFTTVSAILSYCRNNPPPPDAVSRVISELRWGKVIEDRAQVSAERIYVLPYVHPINNNVSRDVIYSIIDFLRSHNVYPIGVAGTIENLNISMQVDQGIKLYTELNS